LLLFSNLIYKKTMLLLEFNKDDRKLIDSIGDIFTISLEFELETDDTGGIDTNMDPDNYLKIAKNNSSKYINDEYKGDDKKEMYDLVDEILDQLILTGESEDNDYNIEEVFGDYMSDYKRGFEKKLIAVLYSDYITYYTSDNIDYLSNKVIEHLPKFFNKWSNVLKFELDTTLKRGIEFSPITYNNNIEECIELVNDFYEDFEKQNYWYMSNRTGVHINVGIKGEKEWNILKGFLMISDEGEQSFVFKDMTWREKSSYTRTLLPILKKEIGTDRKKVLKHTQFDDIKKMEDFFGDYILKKLEKHGYKNFGFNITRIKSYDYVEFRYPGGEITKDTLINKIYYFCYITYLMTDNNYKRREYLKRLYKFISSI